MPHRDDVAGAIALLVQVAVVLDVPVIVTRQNPDGLGDIVADVQSVLPADVPRVDKTAFCCCAEPSFLAALAATGRRQVVLVGMETHICVAQSALALLERER